MDIDNIKSTYITGMLVDSVKIGDSIYTNSPNVLQEFFLSKIDSSKNNIWTIRAKSTDTTIGPMDYSNGLSIEVSNQNKLYVLAEIYGSVKIGMDTINSVVTTRYLLKMDSGGSIQWIRALGCDFFEVDTSGNYYSAFSNTLEKYSDAGNLIWTRTFNFPIIQMDLNDWDQFYVLTDTTLYKINISDGLDIWASPFNTDYAQTINSDSSGKVVVSGSFFGPPTTPDDAATYFEQFSNAGIPSGHFYWGYPLLFHNTTAYDIAFQNDGNLFVLGQVACTSTYPATSTFVYGFDTLPNIGNFDTYTSKIKINDWLTGIKDNAEYVNLNYIIYPNPTTDKLIIEQSKNSPIKTEITLFDLFGRKISSTITNDQTIELFLSSLDSGIYLLRLKKKDSTSTTKIIKQ